MNTTRFARTLAALSALVLAPMTARSDDSLSGTWDVLTEGFGGEPSEATLVVAQDGTGFTGTYDAGFGGPMEIEEGKVENGALSFKVSRTFGERSMTSTFTAKSEGGKLAGSLTVEGFGDPRTVEFEAYRAPEIDPSGLWKWTSPSRREGGEARNNWVKLAYAKGALSGMYLTEDGQMPITDASLEGKEISFAVSRGGFGGRGGRGGSGATTYKGTLDGTGIKGTRTSRRGEEERSEDWVATSDTPEVDPIGTWSWKSRFGREGEEVESSVTITRDGEALAGSFTGRGEEAPVADAKLEGDVLSFTVSRETDRGSFSTVFSGKIDGDALSGDLSTKFGEREMRRRFTAERVLPAGNPEGTWTWSSRRGRGGEEVESKLTLATTDGKLGGTISRGDTETALEDVSVDGNRVTFKVTRTFGDGGNSFTTRYSALVRGDTLKGGFSMEPRAGNASEGEATPAWESFWEAKRAN